MLSRITTAALAVSLAAVSAPAAMAGSTAARAHQSRVAHHGPKRPHHAAKAASKRPKPAPAQHKPAPAKPKPAPKVIRNYVNLGDSYAAGDGLQPLSANFPAACAQASINYAHLLASSRHYSLTDVSCSGAATADFTNAQSAGTAPQLAALNTKTDLVTMMIGGNDNSLFSNVLISCGQLGYSASGVGSPCKNAYGNSFTSTVQNKTYPALVQALKAVRQKAPAARVAIIGYPRLMPENGSCFAQLPIAAGDISYVNGIQSSLNDAIKRAASATGVTFVDAFAASTGHDACKPIGTRWVEPVFGSVTNVPAHPNALGEQALSDLIRRALKLG